GVPLNSSKPKRSHGSVAAPYGSRIRKRGATSPTQRAEDACLSASQRGDVGDGKSFASGSVSKSGSPLNCALASATKLAPACRATSARRASSATSASSGPNWYAPAISAQGPEPGVPTDD